MVENFEKIHCILVIACVCVYLFEFAIQNLKLLKSSVIQHNDKQQQQ